MSVQKRTRTMVFMTWWRPYWWTICWRTKTMFAEIYFCLNNSFCFMESIWPLVTWIKTIHRLLYRAQFVLLIRTTWWYSLDCFVQISFSALAFVNINYEEVRRKSPWGHLVICFRKSIFTSSQEVYYVLAKYGRTPVSRCIYHFGLYYRWREHTWIYWFGWLVLAHQADEEFRKAISGWYT